MRRRLAHSTWLASVVCGATAVVNVAHAQVFGGIEQAPEYSRGYNTSVRERPHPEWAPIDIQLGAFTLDPQLSATASYTNNEKFSTIDPQSDEFFRLQPSFSLASDWNRNGVAMSAFVARTEYIRFGEDDSTEYGVNLAGRVDVSSDVTVDLKGGDQHLVFGRNNPDVPIDTLGPLMYDLQTGQVTVTKTFPEFQVQGIAAIRNYSYGSVAEAGGGIFAYGDASGFYDSFSGRVSYGVSPAVAVFIGALYNAGYRPKFENISQNEQGANLVGGVNFDLSKLARGEVAVGYLYQSYDTPGVKSDSGVAFNVNVQYFPSELTTVSLTAQRSTAPTNVVGSAGGISVNGTLSVDHELLRNLILSANVSGGQTDYRDYLVVGSERFDRIDTGYGGGLGATYLMNRLVSWEFAYDYASYKSTDALRRSFTNNRLALTLRLTR